MINITDKSKCCGCRACEQACPVGCISQEIDSEGFNYPKVDAAKCINCGACDKVCPIIVAENKPKEDGPDYGIDAYGGWITDEDVRQDSSSGGAFTALADSVLDEGGKVYGCYLDSDKKAVHIGIDSKDQVKILRGSKYVQSDTLSVYSEIQELINSGRKVLFVGAPCQCAGLDAFIKKNRDKLFTVDFICHGVPTPRLFADYINSLESKKGSKITAFRFRNKDKGWNQSGLQLGTYYEFEDGSSVRNYPAFNDKFMNAFLDDIALRPCCYECKFKSLPKYYADFTIADFWGVNHCNKELNDKKGTSLILVHSNRGKKFWEGVKSKFNCEKVDFKSSITKNPTIIKSVRRKKNRDKFFEDYNNYGYEYVEKKYMSAFTWAFHKCLNIALALFNKFQQFIKFGIVGISNVVICLLVYYVGIYFGLHYNLAYAIGFVVSVINAFYWNNKYVFKNKQETNTKKAFVKVFMSYGASFLLSIAIMSFLVEIIGVPSFIAPILKMIVTIPINFVLNKVWAFKDRKVKSKA